MTNENEPSEQNDRFCFKGFCIFLRALLIEAYRLVRPK